jgi:hypothetical protein
MTKLDYIPQEQAECEREAIFGMMEVLKSVQDAGYNDFQTLTSFIANLLIDQPNPRLFLKHMNEMVKQKLELMADMKRGETLQPH